MEAKILSFDLESCGVNALHSDLGFVAVIGYKWLHEKQVHSITIEKKDLEKFDDSKVLLQFASLYGEADLVVGHFASVFDRRFLQGRLLIHGLPPLPPTKLRDTCMIARSVANYSSNRLKHLAKVLSLKNQKLENSWPEAWFKVMQGDMKALKGMATYCEGDVLAVEELYKKLAPYDNAHPRIVADRARCGLCGGTVQYRGFALSKERRYRRYQCTKCLKWGQEGKAV